jgi:glycine/D-amino acid oxidase-like deaminating enzyme
MKIAVICAGIVGALTALRLVKPGEEVTVIDKYHNLSERTSGNIYPN